MNTENNEILEARMNPSKSKKPSKCKSRKRSTKKPDRDSQSPSKSTDVTRPSSENDPQWYASNQQLLQDAFSLSLPYALGSAYSLPDITGTNPTTSSSKHYVPGVAAICVTPCPGVSGDRMSAVNLAAAKMYSWIRHANSGAANYDPADLMMYILAMDNCYMLFNFLKRAYGIMRTYNQKNRYMPKALIETMNLDFDDLSANLCTFRSAINKLATALSSFAVPATLPYITRHAWLFSGLYADAPSFKSQTFLYNPSKLFKFVEKTPTGELAYLEPVSICLRATAKFKIDGVSALVKEFTNPLLSSQDFNIISGDILKAYGLANVISIAPIGEDYMVLPTYSEEVLSQIENTYALAETDNTTNITQSSNGNIVYSPKAWLGWANTREARLINFHKDVVTPEDVAVATRLCPVLDMTASNPGSELSGVFAATGSEIPDLVKYYTLQADGTIESFAVNAVNDVTDVNYAYTVKANNTISAFHCAPLHEIVYAENKEAPNVLTSLGRTGDLDNYTVLYDSVLANMHDVALLSLFDVPTIAGS